MSWLESWFEEKENIGNPETFMQTDGFDGDSNKSFRLPSMKTLIPHESFFSGGGGGGDDGGGNTPKEIFYWAGLTAIIEYGVYLFVKFMLPASPLLTPLLGVTALLLIVALLAYMRMNKK